MTVAEFLSDLNVLLSMNSGLNRNVKVALKRLGEHEGENDESLSDLYQQAIAFNRLYEVILSKIDYKFATHAH